MKNIRTRNIIVISLIIILGIGTACLGGLGLWGGLMVYSFLFLPPGNALIMTNDEEISSGTIIKRNNIAISLIIILSIGTAFLGWLGAWGILMFYAFFFLSPVIALIATKNEFYLSIFYVVLTSVIYWMGMVHWGYIGEDWLTDHSGEGALQQMELFGTGLCCSMFTTLLVFFRALLNINRERRCSRIVPKLAGRAHLNCH